MNSFDEFLSLAEVSLKGLIASTDELSRQVSKSRIADSEEGKTKRTILDYLSVASDAMMDCSSLIAERKEVEQP